MENNLKTQILKQQALDNELIEATQAQFVLLMADLLEKGANPHFIPNDFRGSLLDRILDWHKAEDIAEAVKLLCAHNFNPNIGISQNGNIVKRLCDQKTEFEQNMTNQTLIFSAEESQQFINTLNFIEKELLKRGATPIVPLKSDNIIPYFRRGRKNPEPITDSIFFHIITNNVSPYALRKTLKVPNYDDSEVYGLYLNSLAGKKTQDIPERRLWNYKRYGTSRTILPDGSVIFIGGEHEDYYDPDFCIFNDVLKIDKTGQMHLFFYPQTDFKPTDFHTATYFDNDIIIIGNLGYLNDRNEHETPVYRLRLSDYSIEKMYTKGDNPKWIFNHSACVHEGKIVVWGGEIWGGQKSVANDKVYSLNPKSHVWEKH